MSSVESAKGVARRCSRRDGKRPGHSGVCGLAKMILVSRSMESFRPSSVVLCLFSIHIIYLGNLYSLFFFPVIDKFFLGRSHVLVTSIHKKYLSGC